MLRTPNLISDQSLTTSEHWIRPFDIIDVSTGDESVFETRSMDRFHPHVQQMTTGTKELTFVMGVTSRGTPCQIWGHRWLIEPGFDVVLQGIVTGVHHVSSHVAEDDTTSIDDVETPQEVLLWIKDVTGLADADISELLGVSRPTLNAWRRGENISTPRLRRLYAIRDVLRRAATRLPSREYLRAWLVTPRGADGRTPEELLRTGEIDRARLLAMSMPSARVARPLDVMHQSTSATWHRDAEYHQLPELPEDEQDVPAVARAKGTRRVVLTRRSR